MTVAAQDEKLFQILSIVIELINERCGFKEKFRLVYVRDKPGEEFKDKKTVTE